MHPTYTHHTHHTHLPTSDQSLWKALDQSQAEPSSLEKRLPSRVGSKPNKPVMLLLLCDCACRPFPWKPKRKHRKFKKVRFQCVSWVLEQRRRGFTASNSALGRSSSTIGPVTHPIKGRVGVCYPQSPSEVYSFTVFGS